MRSLRGLAAAALLATGLVAGCGGGGDTTVSGSDAPATTQQVVIEAGNGQFNPAAIYKDVSPGVVTIISLFSGGGGGILGGGGGAGQGSGFVIDKEGHIVTNAHVVTNG